MSEKAALVRKRRLVPDPDSPCRGGFKRQRGKTHSNTCWVQEVYDRGQGKWVERDWGKALELVKQFESP